MYHLDNIAIWDRQVKAIEQELNNLESLLSDSRSPAISNINKERRTLKDLRDHIDRQLAAISAKYELEATHNNKERSYVYWARKYAEKISFYIQQSSIAAINDLWVDLIYTRLCGSPPATSASIQGLEMGLKSRLAILRRNEKQMKQALQESKEKEKSSKQRYHRLVVTKANMDASVQPPHCHEQILSEAHTRLLDFVAPDNQIPSNHNKLSSHKLKKVTPPFAQEEQNFHSDSTVQDFINDFDYENLEKELH